MYEYGIINAIVALDADAQVSVNGESLDGITWHDGNPNNITNDQITAKQAELKALYDNHKYYRDRELAFRAKSVKEQLDMQYHDAVNGTTTWKDWVKSIKDAHPKP